MKYRKKQTLIEAVKWDGHNNLEVEEFAFGHTMWCGDLIYRKPSESWKGIMLSISTSQGLKKVEIGDYILKGLDGEFYAILGEIFESNYELVEG